MGGGGVGGGKEEDSRGPHGVSLWKHIRNLWD